MAKWRLVVFDRPLVAFQMLMSFLVPLIIVYLVFANLAARDQRDHDQYDSRIASCEAAHSSNLDLITALDPIFNQYPDSDATAAWGNWKAAVETRNDLCIESANILIGKD